MHYAYLYTDPSRNDEPFYVGKGSGSRAYVHLKGNKANPHFHYRIQKLLRSNTPPTISKIECSSKDSAFLLEKGLIRTIGRLDLKTGSLLNMNEGGQGGFDYVNELIRTNYEVKNRRNQNHSRSVVGRTKTQIHKQKIAVSNVGKHEHHGESNPMFNRNHTMNTKLLQSEARKKEHLRHPRKWINNGSQNSYVLKESPIPNGWSCGRLMNRNNTGRFY